MKKLLMILMGVLISISTLPIGADAAAGIFPSGGGSKTVGQSFSVSVVASGGTFNAFQGTISVSGPVSVLSVSAGSADTWMSRPSNGGTFSGALLGRTATSLTIATLSLKGTSVGSGSVSVSGVSLLNGATTVSNSGGSTSFTIQRAPDLPGAVAVTSTSHPDQNESYEATTIELSWIKASGVDAFSYLLDQTADTAPPAKTTSSETSVSYADQAIGTYYFHIRAHKADGWGGTTHFKINIKEPEPKVDETLNVPSEIEIIKADDFANNITDGTILGIIIKGKVTAGFDALIKLTPALTLPEGKTLTVTSDTITGNFEYLIDFPIPSGFYRLIVQGQKEKVLTPESDLIRFEISQKDGGSIEYISDDDAKAPQIPLVKGSFLQKKYSVMNYLIVTLILAALTLSIIEFIKFIKRRRNPHLN
jgi:hypothetical protein